MMIMKYPKAVLVLSLYILIETRALPTAINGTDQSKNVTKQADERAEQEAKLEYVNTVKLQDVIFKDIKKSNRNACMCCDDHRKECSCKDTAVNCMNIYKNKVGTHENKKNPMKCDNHNDQKSSNCRNKRHGNGCDCGCEKGKAGNCGQVTVQRER